MGVEEVVAWMKEMMEMVIRAATGVGIPTIGRYAEHFSWSIFLEAKGSALLHVQKCVHFGIFDFFFF